MRAVLPGKPRATLQAVCTGRWDQRQLVIYVTGNCLAILDGPESLVQTVRQDEIERLDAVAFDNSSGKIAASAGGTVFVYEPYGLEEYTKWSLQTSITVPGAGEGRISICTLSWGMPGELLVGSSSLRIYHVDQSRRLVWEQPLPNDAQHAVFSSDADLVASVARCDPLVKVWRRISGGPDTYVFDFCYLPHPEPVTSLFWRKPEKRASQGGQHVLYTVCADNKLRVWAQLDHHSLQILELWGELDLLNVIQPRHLKPESQSEIRHVYVIPGSDFDAATKQALRGDLDPRKRPFLEHLGEIAEQKPDICVVLDNKGHMSAWGLQNIGSKRRKESDIFNIALVEDFNLVSHALSLDGDSPGQLQILGFLRDTSHPSYSVIVHYKSGSVSWVDGRMDEYFDPAPSRSRLRRQALWTGHEQPIEKMTRNASGLASISRSKQGEALVWKSGPNLGSPAMLRKNSTFAFRDKIQSICVLDHGSHFVTLTGDQICLWTSKSPSATQIACCQLKASKKPVCVLRIPSSNSEKQSRYVAVLTADFEGAVYEISISDSHEAENSVAVSGDCTIVQFCDVHSGNRPKYSLISAVDPVGHLATNPEHLDIFAPDIVLACTDTGLLETFAAKLNTASRSLSWEKTACIDSALQNVSLVAGSSSRKVAVVDEAGTGLLIWDTTSGDLEFDQSFDAGEVICDLDWTATPDSQSLLAVGFPHKILIYGQMRYNYLHPEPAWAVIREVDISSLTPNPIGDSTWLAGGNLIIGAGNQLFLYDDFISGQDKTVKDIPIATHVTEPGRLFTRVNLLNGPLPVFHPQFLTQTILAGKLALAQQIVVTLFEATKFYTEGEDLSLDLGISVEELVSDDDESLAQARSQQTSRVNGSTGLSDRHVVTEELASALNAKLMRTPLPYMSSQDQFYLSNLIESVALMEKQRRSVDTNAARFVTFFRQFMLIKRSEHQLEAGITWREYAWAFHSSSQDILTDLVTRQYSGKLMWTNARESGVFMWMTDLTALKAQFEIVARNEYTRTDERNPVDCSLYYLALRKKNVLLGLWRMASWNREQAGTQKLLAHNFSEARWQTAALKNAYALLGKRRFEYAAAFFLLADHLQDAVNVCINQVGDLQLAIAVARVYEGDDSAVLHQLLRDHVLPKAASSGDRWQASWAFWMLGQRDRAVRALITPIWTLIDSTLSPTIQARSFLANDPALVAMYAQCREKSLQALKGSTQISPQEEWQFILRTIRLYCRMGCDYLALSIARNWSFLQLPPLPNLGVSELPASAAAGVAAAEMPDPRKLLRRRSSLVVDDLSPTPAAPRSPTLTMRTGGVGHGSSGSNGTAAAKKPPPPPTMFEEPASSSLLDQFGF